MASFNAMEYGAYLALVRPFNPLRKPVAAVLVQGPDAPYILSALHCFEKETIQHNCPYTAYLFSPDQVVHCEFSMANPEHDFILFRLVDFIDRQTAPIDVQPDSCNVGKAYIMFGYSTCFQVDANGRFCMTWSASPGHMASMMLGSRCVAASGGSVPGDSGGPIFSSESKKLIGINLAVANVIGEWSIQESARARMSAQALIKPLWLISDLLNFHLGSTFFGPGGMRAVYNRTSLPTASKVERRTPLFPVPRRPQELLCVAAPKINYDISELFNGELLDPYANDEEYQ